ncbi:hypothetical protein U1Q18_037506 [Sarracenia purpurea var. burkii]
MMVGRDFAGEESVMWMCSDGEIESSMAMRVVRGGGSLPCESTTLGGGSQRKQSAVAVSVLVQSQPLQLHLAGIPISTVESG